MSLLTVKKFPVNLRREITRNALIFDGYLRDIWEKSGCFSKISLLIPCYQGKSGLTEARDAGRRDGRGNGL